MWAKIRLRQGLLGQSLFKQNVPEVGGKQMRPLTHEKDEKES